MKRPRGFTILAVILGLMIWDPVMRIVFPRPVDGVWAAVLLALEALIVALMAISIEALWRVRPWAARASGALCAAVTLKYLVGVNYRQETEMVVIAITGPVLLAVMLAIPLVYVQVRTEAIHGRPVRRRRPRTAPPIPAPTRQVP